MRRIIIQEKKHIHPFNEPARDLRVHNLPLWLWQRDMLSAYFTEEREYSNFGEAQLKEGVINTPTLVHKDNIFFNQALITDFISRATSAKQAVQIAFHQDDAAITEHVLPLSRSFRRSGQLLLGNLWYFPAGIRELENVTPLVIDSSPREVGYYHVPPYLATLSGDLVYQLPRKAFVSIDSWVHLFVVDILFGVFSEGKLVEENINTDWRLRIRILLQAMLQQKRVLDSSGLVKIGKNTTIDPSAIIHGPTTIGNNVTIGPGVVIDNCLIGNNVNISQGCQLMLSVVSDGCFLPFRAALFMSTLMENTMVAQNSCLQLCVVGRDTFIGAGTTFTDFKLLPGPLNAKGGSQRLEETNFHVLGGCVGHNCRLASGLVLYPARTVESDVVILAEEYGQLITHDVKYEESSHHKRPGNAPHPRYYPRAD